MSHLAIRAAVTERFVDEVATPEEVPVVHDNAPPPAKASTWCRLAVLFDGDQQITACAAGERRYRSTGRLVALLFCRAETGDGDLLTLCDAITEAFRGVVETDPIIYYGVPSPAGASERDEGWWRRVVTIPFEADTFG